MSLGKENTIDPTHGTRCGNNKIHLAVVDEDGYIFVQEVFDPVDFWFHKICVEVVVDLFTLGIVDYLGVEGVDSCGDFLVAEVWG